MNIKPPRNIESIKVFLIGTKKYIHSLDFYLTIGLANNNYTQWLIKLLHELGRPGIDYMPTSENQQGRTIRFRLRYYLEIDFAIGLCLVAKRKQALRLREHLIDKKESNDFQIIKEITFSKAIPPFKDTKFLDEK